MTGARQPQGNLFNDPVVAATTININDRCLIRAENDYRIVVVAGIALAHYAIKDRMAEAYAMVGLIEQGWASQKQVAGAFGCSSRSIRRYQRRLADGGIAALVRAGGYPSGRRRLSQAREQLIHHLKIEGISNKEIARRLGVTPKAIRKLLKRMGWCDQGPEQIRLPVPAPRGDPNLSAFSNVEDGNLPVSFDMDPADRRVDRLLAYLGVLDDAAPLFRSSTRVRGGGVLLAIPALVQSGVFSVARKIYGSIGPAFYGLRNTFVALLIMALLRIKRPEALKEHSPDDLGRILGLDRAPEVKTLRRKLSRLAALSRAAELGRALAQKRVAERGAAMGFMYVDGHVRVYHGKRTLPKTHVARRRLAMSATTDYWVNDSLGDPLFVVTAEANAGMVKMLPIILEEVRTLVGERRITVAFDRGGFSPKLFLKLISEGFDVLTYRKGRTSRIPRSRFTCYDTEIDGFQVSYQLADQGVRLLNGKLRMRQVTRLGEDGHQTPILTSRRDLSAAEVAFRMFERWRQENFFKYLREEYALDALVDYNIVPDNPFREVPNPKRLQIAAELQRARAEFDRITAEYGAEAFMNADQPHPTMKTFKAAHQKLAQTVRAAFDRITKLERKRDGIPARIPVGDFKNEVVKLDPERKLLTNLIKMVAYQAESDLVHIITRHYKRAHDEGRTLIQSAFAASADIVVSDTELRVNIAPLSSPHRTHAIAALCEDLNRSQATFPGSKLRLRFSVASSK
jgi:transposase